MKKALIAALLAATATGVAADEMPPPDADGIIEIEARVGDFSTGLIVNYAPPANGTSRVELVTESIAKTVSGDSSTEREPMHLREEFTLDPAFASSEKFAVGVVTGDRIARYPIRIHSATVDQIETSSSRYETLFTAELDVLSGTEWRKWNFVMESSDAVDLLTIFREGSPGLVTARARHWSVSGLPFSERVFTLADVIYGPGLVHQEFVFYPQWMYYTGDVEGELGYPVYHLSFNEHGEPVRIGWLKRTITGGEKANTPNLSASEAVARLRQMDWEFEGNRYADGPGSATASFGSGFATVEKLEYQIQLTQPDGGVVIWQERFIPDGADEPTDIRWMSWNPDLGDSESPVYQIDPLEEGNPHRFPGVAGTYEVILVDVTGALVADLNRDQKLSLPEESLDDVASPARPFRYWINDDDDRGPIEGDDIPARPLSRADFANVVVDSNRDLVDFFPVCLDIKQLLMGLPPTTAGITYKLKHADGALNFVYTARKRSEAFDYQIRDLGSAFGPSFTQPAGAATTQQVTPEGVPLNPIFLDGIRNNDLGVILVEGRVATTKPLRLVVETNGSEIAELPLNISIRPVEEMFQQVNLTNIPKNYDGSAPRLPEPAEETRRSEPANWPDSETNGKYFVFLHGYNVDGQEARGWQAEVFKRLHVLGSKARFVGVTWHGATGLDYHRAVFHAFQTGDALQQALSFTGDADLTVAAHSLGNVVVSHAIQAGGFIPSRYFLINAATPLEAYAIGDVGSDEPANMTEGAWRKYDTRLYPETWHAHFSSPDSRGALTWKLLFQNVTLTSGLAHNFFSEEEDVVADANGSTSASIMATLLNQGFNFSTGAWKAQELVKGVDWSTSLVSAFMVRSQGGWGFNLDDWYTIVVKPGPPGQGHQQVRRRLKPNQTTLITNEELKVKPFFRLFLESALTGADPSSASRMASEPLVRYDLLARAVPAMSNAVAANFMTSLGDRNFPMHSRGKDSSNGAFPTPNGKWRHSDFKLVGLTYVHPMYEEMVNRAVLR